MDGNDHGVCIGLMLPSDCLYICHVVAYACTACPGKPDTAQHLITALLYGMPLIVPDLPACCTCRQQSFAADGIWFSYNHCPMGTAAAELQFMGLARLATCWTMVCFLYSAWPWPVGDAVPEKSCCLPGRVMQGLCASLFGHGVLI